MPGSTRSTPSPTRTRRWRVPPPLTRGSELLEGAEILQELAGESAVLLWKSLRTVTLWAGASPREQADLFSEGAHQRRLAELLVVELDDALVEPLRVLADLIASPARTRREVVALACRQIAQWAEAQGAAGTALAFAQAAALASPGDAALAYQVGKLARGRGEMARAESWYRRAIMLGRQTQQWEAYARAYVALGNLSIKRGNFPLARRCHIKAYRAAKRHSLREVQAMALHDLFVIAGAGDDAAAAERYAQAAFRAYGPRHRNIRFLAHDICCLWMEEGQFGRALPVLRALVPHFPDEERLLIVTNLVRAAGGTGDRAVFEEAWEEAEELLKCHQTRGTIAWALLMLARGAMGVGEWERAVVMAEEALEVATRYRESKAVFDAEAVLSSARSRKAVELHAHEQPGNAAPEEDSLVEDLVFSLSGAAGA